MPDLPDELRSALHDAAAHAPAVPPPAPDLPRRVARRRAARTTAMLTVPAVATVAFVAVAFGAAPDRQEVIPADPPLAPTDLTGKYEFCDLANPAAELDVAVHATEWKFAQGCYVVRAGFTSITFDNPQDVPHDLAVVPESEKPWEEEPLAVTAIVEEDDTSVRVPAGRIPPGDYAMFCQVHPLMHAQLVVRY